MKYIIDTPDFKLTLGIRLYDKKTNAYQQYPQYYPLNINVECDGFLANTVLNISLREISEFSEKLFGLYKKLNGTALLKEYYCDDKWIEFFGDGKGHMFVKGKIYNFSKCHTKELYFENEFDQTYLKDFATKLYNDFVV